MVYQTFFLADVFEQRRGRGVESEDVRKLF